MDYTRVTGSDVEDLIFHVKESIYGGFEPLGGVAVGVSEDTETGHNETFFQAMI